MRYADWKSSGTQLLYTGSVSSIIRIYDAKTFKERGFIPGINPNLRNEN